MADFRLFKRQRRAAIEQAAVEFENVLKIEVAAFRHVVEEAGQERPGLSGLALGRLQQLFPQAVWQQFHAVGEEAEDELIDEMGHRFAVGIAMLQRVGNGLELVGRLLGKFRARSTGAQFIRIVEDGAKMGEV